jgi:phage anti-repressor protein
MADLMLKGQVETLYQQAQGSDQEFCIDLEGEAPDGRPVWEWMGYSTKGSATRSLSKLVEGVDFLTVRLESSGGRPSETAAFSREGFKQWGMLAGTDRGRQIRLYFIECEKRLQLGMSQPTALNSVMNEIQVAHRDLTQIVIHGFNGVQSELKDVKTTLTSHTERLDRLEKARHRRRAVPLKHQAVYRTTVEKSYEGACPCCRQHKPHMEFDHWYDRSKAGLDEVWWICTDCNRKLGPGGSQERKAHERQFHGFQDRLLDFANGFQTELELS